MKTSGPLRTPRTAALRQGGRRLLAWRAVRSVAIVAWLAAAYALFALAPEGGDPRIAAIDRELARLERMALVVPERDSGIAAFFLDRFETSNEEWDRFVAATLAADERPVIRRADDGRHPVTFVTLDQALAYAAFAGKTIPTAMEWNAAASELLASDGFAIRDAASRYRMNVLETGIGATVRCGTFEGGRTRSRDRIGPPIHDLIGNVAEWAIESPSEGAAALGASFNDSLAREGFGRQQALPGERNFAVGFRCAIPAADRWLRELLGQLADLPPAVLDLAAARLAPFQGPLDRLLRRERFAAAVTRRVALDTPLRVTDRVLDAGGGALYRIRGGEVEILDVDAEAGVAARRGDLGAVRAVAVGRAESRGGERERRELLVASVEPEFESSADAATVFVLPQQRGGPLLLDVENGVVVTPASRDAPELPSGPLATLAGHAIAWRQLAPPLPFGGATDATRLRRFVARGDELVERFSVPLTAAEGIVCGEERVLVHAALERYPPRRDPLLATSDTLLLLAILDRRTGALEGSTLVGGPAVGVVALDPALDRIAVVRARDVFVVSGLAPGDPRIVTPLVANSDQSFARVLALPQGGALVERRTFGASGARRSTLLRLGATGEIKARRDLRGEGVLEIDLAPLRDGSVAVLDADGALLVLEADLELRFRVEPQGVAYDFDFAAPVEIDLGEGRGTPWIAIPLREGGVELRSSRDGSLGESLPTDGPPVLGMTGAVRGKASGDGELLAVELEGGILTLGFPRSASDRVAKELLRRLAPLEDRDEHRGDGP
jgi:hypothetical protein